MTPLMIMVGADKGGVGKTTVARVVIDYLATRNVKPKVFDTETPSGDLARFPFAAAEIVDIERIAGKVRVFDAVDQGAAVIVVDMRAGLLSKTLQALDDAGLLTAVRANELNLALLHVLGPTPTSLNEVLAASQAIGGGSLHFVVKNNIAADDVFGEWTSSERYAETFARMAPATVTVPRLPEEVSREIQSLGVSFAAFAADRTRSRTMRGLVLTWLRQVWGDLDKIGLGQLAAAAVAPAQ